MEEIIEDTSGFYKLDGELIFGPNFVLNKYYELRRETKDQHTYPTDGWHWFDTKKQAEEFYGIPATESTEESSINIQWN